MACIQCSNGQYNLNSKESFCRSCPDQGLCIQGIITAKPGLKHQLFHSFILVFDVARLLESK